MAETENGRKEDLRELLTDAIEVQLAALKAGIGFWTEWIERTTEFVQSATQTLSEITSEEPEAKDLLLELVDAGRASVRGMTEIPRNTATRFIEELDRFKDVKAKKAATKKKTTKKKTAKKKASKKKATKKSAAKKETAKKVPARKKSAPRRRAARAKS